jgi:hypothetical protein
VHERKCCCCDHVHLRRQRESSDRRRMPSIPRPRRPIRCRYCEQVFQPSKFQPGQSVCSGPECQRRRRADNRRRKIASDPEYRQVCQDSCRKWRASHPDYWRRRREGNPTVVGHNRQKQRVGDQKRRLRDLANNNSAFDLKQTAAQVWLIGPGLEHLADNNSARAQTWVLVALPPRRGLQMESCQQQRSGLDAVSAG